MGGGTREAERRRPRRRLRKFLRLCAVSLLLLGLVYLFRDRLVHPLLVRAATFAADRWGGIDLRIDEMTGNLFMGLRLRGIHLRVRDEGSGFRSLAADRIETRYSLWGLATTGLEGIREIRAEGIDLVLEEAEGSSPTEPDEPAEPFRLPDALPILSIRGVSIRASLGGGTRLDVPRADLEARDGRLDLQAAGVQLEDPGLGTRRADLRASLRYAGGRVDLESLRLDGEEVVRESVLDLSAVGEGRVRGDVRLDAFGGTGRIEGSVDGGVIEGSFSIEGVRAGDVFRWLDPSAEDEFEATAGATGRLRIVEGLPEEGEAQVSLRDVRVRGENVDSAGGHVRVADGTIRSEGFDLVWGSNRARLESLEIPVPGPDLADLLTRARARFALELSDLPALAGAAPLDAIPPHRIRLSGEIAAGQGRIDAGALEFPEGTVRIAAGRIALSPADPANVSEAAIELRLEADVHDLFRLGPILGTAPWKGSLRGTIEVGGSPARPTAKMDLRGEGIDTGGVAVGRLRLVAEGRAEETGARLLLQVLEIESEAGTIALARPSSVEWEGQRVQAEAIDFTGTLGEGSASISSTEGETRFRLSLTSAGASALLAGFLPEGIGLGTVHASIEGALAEGRLDLEGAGGVGGVRIEPIGSDLDLTWRARLAKGEAVVEELRLRDGETILVDLEGRAPLDLLGPEILPDGEIALRGEVRPPPIERIASADPDAARALTGRLAARLELSGSWRALRGRIEVEGEEIAFVAREPQAEPLLAPVALSAEVVLGEDALEVARLSLRSPGRFEADASGRLETGSDLVSLLAGAERSILDAPMRVEGTITASDPSWIAARSEAIRRLAGRLRISARVEGTIRDPRISGSGHLEGGELRVAAAFPPLEALEGDLRFEEDRVLIERLRGELGGSPFRLEGTVADLLGSPSLEIDLAGENLLLHRSAALRVRADSNLRIRGTLDRPRIEGEISLRGSRFGKNVDILGFSRSGGGPAGRRGFQVFSFRDPPLANAEFDVRVTSAEPFEVRNNVAAGAIRPELRLGGTGRVPVVTGLIYVDATKVSLPASAVTVEAGTIRFDEENPFLPVLDIRAGARLRGYDTTIHVTGPFDRPEVLLSSVPPLPNRDLLLLVLAGKPPEEKVSSRTGERAAQSVVVFLAQDFLGRWFAGESTESEESILERFEVRTGRDVTRSGDETTEASFRVTRGMLFEKDTVYLTAEQDAYSQYNFGVRFVVRFR